MVTQEIISINTSGRGTIDITDSIAKFVAAANIDVGLCHIFNQHTSASLMLCENYDESVRQDLEMLMQRIAPDGDAAYQHTIEGPDDMPAHARTVLTHSDLTIPVTKGELALGTWQGIYLWEHRTSGHTRNLIVTIS